MTVQDDVQIKPVAIHYLKNKFQGRLNPNKTDEIYP